MTIFQLKQLASTSVHAAADAIGWHYDRAELIADGIVHIVGVCLGLIAASVLVVLTAIYATALEIAVVSVYVAGLLSMLVLSATYNLWPVSRTKWVLRRFDHSAIYVLIAATYTPFIMELRDSVMALALLIGVWCVAIFGIVLKLGWPGRFDRVAVGLYLPLGWRGVAATVQGAALQCDVAKEKHIHHVIDETERQFGPIALFCSNAGIGGGFDPLSVNAGGTSDEPWQRSWAIHVMAHVYAARHLVPRMKARGGGYFLNTISAAGLLSQVGSPAYSTTKHAAVGFAENLAISHRAHGIKVSILCPQGVDTNMLRSIPKGPQSGDGDLSPEQVAQDALKGIEQETFVILPHPQVLDYMRKKTENYDRWIGGMAKIQARMRESYGKP